MAIWNCEGYLLSGLGIGPGHAVYADSQGALDGWAMGKQKGTFTQYSYTRPDSQSINAWAPGSCHVAMKYTDATAIDYIMFRNNDIDSSRWYYGAVRHREYVNVNSTRLWFSLDYWMTFHDELKRGIGACLVERTHVKQADDWDGGFPSFRYLNPEPVVPRPLSKMYDEWNEAFSGVWDALVPNSYVVYAASDENGNGNYSVRMVGGTPTACYTRVCGSAGELGGVIAQFNDAWPVPFYDTSNPDSIFAVTYVPSELSGSSTPTAHMVTTQMPNRGSYLRTDGTRFHNAKCFTYPYMYMSAKAPSGQELMIKFEEYAEHGRIQHYVEGAGGVNSKYRYGVRQSTGDDRVNMRFLTLPEYPQIPVRSDSYAQWEAANGMGTVIGGVIATTMIAIGLMSMPAIAGTAAGSIGAAAGGRLGSALSNVTLGSSMMADRVNSINQAYHAADTMVGKASGMDAVAFNLYRVGFYLNSASKEDLTAVDDYFDAFGYNVNKYEVPNLKVRQYYTYVKTSNAVVRAAVPMDGINQLTGMLNGGTTFWNIGAGDPGVKRGENPDA